MRAKAGKGSGPTRAVVYTRVSTGKQAESRNGLDAQLDACRTLAAQKGWTVLEECTDEGISGKDSIAQRPGLARVLELASKRDDVVVIVHAVSRLARRQRLLWELLDNRGDHQLQIVSCKESFDTTTSAGRAMLGMLATFAALEADMCSERTSAALQARKARGHHSRPAPAGGGAARRRARVAPLVRDDGIHARDARRGDEPAGNWTARGKEWHATTVARTLRQPLPMPEGEATT